MVEITITETIDNEPIDKPNTIKFDTIIGLTDDAFRTIHAGLLMVRSSCIDMIGTLGDAEDEQYNLLMAKCANDLLYVMPDMTDILFASTGNVNPEQKELLIKLYNIETPDLIEISMNKLNVMNAAKTGQNQN